ncbi:hypothetical protein [Mesorhizobium sp. M1B.F.Ca.ET.045.04.1.1]|uniref:hypothetical protein n=1 Tax=Mesorhizobium sp. M1B.F.Ca.ET.045.04.1.1 TaxID=2493673 RepID=UPI000F76539C|nr:hypothetical protein [Mesorhizobium sp. M1B.F.Ca.ET.045.04.1.1]AZO32522.1 hypothetical protein EJ071_37890 [Mesorhizobium sp. M1B.F.Ca.ET.045.04.1.1]
MGKHWSRFTSLALLIGMLASHSLSAKAVELPLDVPLIKLEYPGNPPNIRMLYVKVLFLGKRKIDQPLLFDTGSSGMTIDCAAVLPALMCSEKGIKIQHNQELDGITVTTQKAVMHYGTYDEYGNIASARVTFGGPDSPASTEASIPFLIRYKEVRRSTGEIVGGPLWPKGTFGVSPVGGGGPNQLLKSPMDAVRVRAGLQRGFYFSPIGTEWKTCTNEEASCPEVQALHIGIPEGLKGTFKLKRWTRASERFNFPTVDSCISWGKRTSCRPTLYDTGNSTIMIAEAPPARSNMSLDSGVSVVVKTQGIDDWNFVTTYKPEVEFVPALAHNIMGIRYFETNSVLFDLDAKEIGVRIGN